jgi:anthranilate synthase/aminodeoxychorismate synthase-like glutamine amidotransferase
MFLMVDNQDSFVWNLVRYLQILTAEVMVVRSDKLDLQQILAGGYQGIVLSPGPGTPEKAGRMPELLRRLDQAGMPVPLFGVCLGMQAIAQLYGARVIRGPKPMHGKVTPVWHDQLGVFSGLPSPYMVTRYHSLVVDPAGLPPELLVSSHDQDGNIMAVRHRDKPVEGVQFHPEAELTEHGLKMLKNFVDFCARYQEECRVLAGQERIGQERAGQQGGFA